MKYFLWSAVKEKCFADKPEAIELLKAKICDAIVEIRAHTLEKVHENFSDRMKYYEASRDSHMNEIIFHAQHEQLYFKIKNIFDKILKRFSLIEFLNLNFYVSHRTYVRKTEDLRHKLNLKKEQNNEVNE